MTAAVATKAISSAASTAQALRALADGGDPKAWGLIIEKYAADMYRSAYRILGERTLAEDACQEAFLQVRAGAARFRANPEDPEGSARAWLVRVAASCALLILRSRRRRSFHERQAHQLQSEQAPRAANNVLGDALRNELADLPEAQRLPLVLHYFGGLDYRQISAQVGCSVGAARVRVSRAIDLLRRRLMPAGIILSAGAVASRLGAQEAIALPANLIPNCFALAATSTTPALASTAVFGGLTLMTKLSLTAMALAAAGVLAFTVPKAIAEEGGGDKPKKEEPRREGDGAKKEGDKPAAPEVKSGTVRGVVVSVKENRLQLKDKEGHTESYMPKWIGGMPADGGGLDKEMVAKLQTLKEGMWVEITWMWEERRRVTSIKVLEEGKGGDRKDGEHKDGEKKDGEHKDGDRK